jgi:hypothetical protein
MINNFKIELVYSHRIELIIKPFVMVELPSAIVRKAAWPVI